MSLVSRLMSIVVAAVLVLGTVLPLARPAAAFQATPVASPMASPVAASDTIADPDGAFTVPIPTNWAATVEDGYVHLVDPEGLIDVFVAAVPEPDVRAAIASTWELVGIEQGEAIDESEVPTPPGVDQAFVLTYNDGSSGGRFAQAVGQLVGETTFVWLVDADLNAIVRRNTQAVQILDGLEIAAVESDDLRGVAPATLTPELLAELEAYVTAQLELQEIPGAAIAIVQDGEVVYRQGFGVRALSGDEPVTPETLMMIGSTTKPLTTTMMATLVDDDLMAWDTPAADILPSFAVADPELSDTITMRQLVCACTGVPRRDLEWVLNAASLTPADMIASLATFEFFTPIGEVFQYSNQMVAAGGYIATLAAGGNLDNLDADYADLMRERVFDPVGMPDTMFAIADAAASPNHALPHARNFDGSLAEQPVEYEAVLQAVAPAGAAWSNVDDMARFMITQLSNGVAPDGERVVSSENLAETRQVQVPIGAGDGYGLGWMIGTYKQQPMIEHGGNTFGFTSDFSFMPESGIGIVILVNAQTANLFTQAVRLRFLELAFGQEHRGDELVEFSLAQQAEQLPVAMAAIGPAPDGATVAPYLGDYTSPALGDISLRMEEGRLVLDAGELSGEVRTTAGELAPLADFLLIEGQIPGLPINLTMEDGAPVLTLVDPSGTSQYVFTALFSSATPVASPAASPIASLDVTPIATPVP